ncbi:helix-turn-helix domain-containing protein [Streptomyces albidoflavus]|uniref:helix-turn-helix domain-containing protein n=1 Tax=Streptomyces albidoflavus TaxID=1886 RepID=UPI00340CF78A
MRPLQKTAPATAPATTEPERDLAYAIATAVHTARTRRGLTQKQLAELTHTKQPRISRVESASELPTLRTLLKISEALGVQLQVTLTELDPGDTSP